MRRSRQIMSGLSNLVFACKVVLFTTLCTLCNGQILPRGSDIPDDDSTLPIYLQPVTIFGKKMYPATIAICVGVIMIWVLFVLTKPRKSMATASHILMSDEKAGGPGKAEKRLKEIKEKEIGSGQDMPRNFSIAANKYSECPSKSRHGLLGSFSEGTMVPPFDKVVFDPNTPLEQVIGPIQTHFGWHLIVVHKRDMAGDLKDDKKKN